MAKVVEYIGKLMEVKSPKLKETDIGIISPYRRQVSEMYASLKVSWPTDLNSGWDLGVTLMCNMNTVGNQTRILLRAPSISWVIPRVFPEEMSSFEAKV